MLARMQRSLIHILLMYRRWLTAAVLALLVWSLLNGSHKGQQIWLYREPLAAGTTIRAADLIPAWLDSGQTTGYLTDPAEIVGQTLVSSAVANSPVMAGQLSPTPPAGDRVVANLPLEAGDIGVYPVGSKLHVWALGDGPTTLITDAGLLIGSSQSALATPRVTVSLPTSAEAAAMQATAVRLVIVP